MNPDRIKIEKIVNGGFGLARLENGQVIMLHNTLSGEIVHIKSFEKRKNTFFGTAEKIIKANIARIEPPCPYYGNCGGCNLQHCTYEEQLHIKDGILNELLQGIDVPSRIIQPIMPSPQQFGYRQRIRMKVHSGKMGFLKFRSNEIIPIDQCLLAHPIINEVLGDVIGSNAFIKLSYNSTEIEFLFNPETSLITCLFHFERKPRPTDLKYAENMAAEIEKLERIFFIGNSFPLDGPYGTTLTHSRSKVFVQDIETQGAPLSAKLQWEVGGFCQVNLQQNHNLIHFVQKSCSSPEPLDILDLFCGMGNFSIPLAHSARSLVGVEGQGAAIRCAKKNSMAAGLNNTQFIKGTIEDACLQLVSQERKFNITVIDPPRQGVPGLAALLSKLTTQKIIYISCDPATLARDIDKLCGEGFSLTEIQPFDMFPQTHHIETVVVLDRI